MPFCFSCAKFYINSMNFNAINFQMYIGNSYIYNTRNKNLINLNNYPMSLKYYITTGTLLIFSFLLIAVPALAQTSTTPKETSIYIGTNGKLTDADHAIFIQKTIVKSSKVTIVQTYHLVDAKWEKLYSENFKRLNDSTFLVRGTGENIKGTTIRIFKIQPDNSVIFRDVVKEVLVREGSAKSVVPLFLHGQVTEYYDNGNKKSVSEFNENQLVSNKNWLENGEKYIDNYFYSADVYPAFKPGNKVLHNHILKGFNDAGIDIPSISGSLRIGFVVMEDGTIDGIKIISGLGPHINSVAVESFKSLKGSWTPAKLNNQTVRFYQVFPINFIYRQYQLEFAEMRGAILHFGAY